MDRKVNLDINDKGIEEVMTQLFSGTANTYTIRDRQIIIGKSENLSRSNMKAEGKDPTYLPQPVASSVSGKVLDSKGLPLPEQVSS